MSREYRFARADGTAIRWLLPEPAHGRPEVEVLTTGGWAKARLGLGARLWRQRKDYEEGHEEAQRVIRKACNATGLRVERVSGWRPFWQANLLRWVVSPPLKLGAPRQLEFTDSGLAEQAYRDQLNGAVTSETLAAARTGWERTRARHGGIEGRAQTFVQAAALTTTLVLANSALIYGDDRVEGLARTVLVPSILVSSFALLLSGVYGLAGTMFTFGRINPDTQKRVVARARATTPQEAAEMYAASMMAAQRRTSLVADWKLQRLKRAVSLMIVGILGLAVASVALLLS